MNTTEREIPKQGKCTLKEFLLELELRRYSINTARSYVTHFEFLINNYVNSMNLMAVDENSINSYFY
ncbi:MAG: hypothetical protein AAGC64_13955 [Bacteroidota bacterium]